MEKYKMLINGSLMEGSDSIDVINPATGEVCATAEKTSAAQLEEAVKAAKKAFPLWESTSLDERKKLVIKLADVLHENANALADLLTREQGKPIEEARGEIAFSEQYLRYFSAQNLDIETIEDTDQALVQVHRKALGVIACITPWNFPVLLAIFKLAPALVAGNTVIVKPAPTTPLTMLELGRLCKDIFPKAVVNVIVGDDDLGPLLVEHPAIAKVSFTGSTETGKKVMSSAGSTLKRLTLELGGCDPAIVLDDADIDGAVAGLAGTAFFNCGQVCIAPKRLYVHESIYDEFCEKLGKTAASLKVGNGQEQDTQMGPLQNKVHLDKVKSFLEDARQNGTIITGGNVIEGPGYFVEPTIVRDITDGTRLVDEEQFGPIIPVVRFSNEDDAVSWANNSPYGLGASVWSRDLSRAKTIALKLQSGTSWINQHCSFGPNIPFCGAKQSGVGVESAREGFLEFTQIQVLNMAK